MPESNIQTSIKRGLERKGCYVVNIRAPSTAGTPDLIVCCEGRFIGLEVKSVKSRTDTGRAKRQARQGEKIQMAGGEWYIVHSLAEALDVVYTG